MSRPGGRAPLSGLRMMVALGLLAAGPTWADGLGNAMLGVPAGSGGGFLAQAAPQGTSRARPAPRAPRTPRAVRAERQRVVTDTTIVVRRGTRFELHNHGGLVEVGTWKRDAVRVQAEHSRRDRIQVTRDKGVVRAEAHSPRGSSGVIQFKLHVPTWMPVALSGVSNDVIADGLEGGLYVETVRGDIAARRLVGAIELRSLEGLVELSESKGSIKVSSVNDGVRLLRVIGDVRADAVNGDIQLLDVTSRDLEATTLNGGVLYDGRVYDDGNYRLSTHGGDIALALTDRANATVSVSTHAGEFAAPFPIRLSRSMPGKRFSFALGTGKAQIDLESFKGAIQLFRPGDAAVLERFKETWKDSRHERIREWKWIMKGGLPGDDLDVEIDADEAPPDPPRGAPRKRR